MPHLWPILSQVCLWLALLAAAAFAIGRRARQPRCRKCRYDMSEHAKQPAPWVCPECGTCHRRRGQLDRRSRPKGLRLTAIFLFAAWYAAGATPRVQERGWPGAIPTLALVLYSPWANPDVSRVEMLRDCDIASTLNKPLPFPERIFQELDTRATRGQIAWPMEYVWAARTQLAFSGLAPETSFTWFRRPPLDLNYYTRGRPELLEHARRNLIMIDTTPNDPPDCDILLANVIGTHLRSNDGISQCRTVGNLLFFQTGSPESIRALRESFAIFASLKRETRHLILEPDAASSVASLNRLRSTTITLDAKEATIGQLLDVVSKATGVRKSARSSPLVGRSGSEATPVPVPAPCDGVAFLDQVFLAAATQANDKWPIGSKGWTLVDGELAISDFEDEVMLASFCLGYHDISGIVADGAADPFATWDAIANRLGEQDSRIDTADLALDYLSDQALSEGGVPVPPHFVQVHTRVRTHLALSRALRSLRALGPLPLRNGTLELPVPTKIQ